MLFDRSHIAHASSLLKTAALAKRVDQGVSGRWKQHGWEWLSQWVPVAEVPSQLADGCLPRHLCLGAQWGHRGDHQRVHEPVQQHAHPKRLVHRHSGIQVGLSGCI